MGPTRGNEDRSQAPDVWSCYAQGMSRLFGIALGVVIGALIIGSSLVITTGVQPHLWGFPAIGIVGYLLSALLGLGVVFDILRNRLH